MSSNKNYPKILSAIFFLLVALTISAQNEKNTFTAYADFVSNTMDIAWELPKGFSDLKTFTVWGPGSKDAGLPYDAVLRSKDANFLVMYPAVRPLFYNMQLPEHQTFARRQLVAEMNTAVGAVDENGIPSKIPAFDFDQQVTILTGDMAKEYFNADTVFVARIPLAKSYKNKYRFCTGIYLSKQNQPSMFFKCFFTKAGKKDEDLYLRRFYETVRYRNDDWVYDQKKFLEESYKLFLETR